MNILHIFGKAKVFYDNYLKADLPIGTKQSAWAAVAGSVISIGAGLISKSSANKKANSALAQRTPYQTPKELLSVVNATQGAAQDGLDPFTLNYLNTQNDRSFSNTAGLAERLGADPNSLSGLFDQKIQNSMKIGAENHALNMQNFSRYLSAEQTLGASRDAEWASKEGMVKDLQQSAQQQKLSADAQINSGINAGIAGLANYGTSQLWKAKNSATAASPNYVAAPDLTLQPNVSSSSVKATGAAIGASVIGFDPLTGKPIYG